MCSGSSFFNAYTFNAMKERAREAAASTKTKSSCRLMSKSQFSAIMESE